MVATTSVIIPTRNRSELLARSLHSVSMQTYPEAEVIVVDDSSSDRECAANLALIQSCCPGAIYLKLPTDMSGRGPGFPRNFGIDHCSGAFVAFLDDDDEWIDPAYLEVATGTMLRHGYEVHFADQEAVFSNGSVQPPPIWTEDWGSLLPQAGSSAADDGSYRVAVAQALRSDGFAHLNTTIVGLALLRDTLKGFDLGITYEEDRELYFRLVDQARSIGYTPGIVSRHHIPAGVNRVSASNTVPDDEKDASRLRWFDNLIQTARHEPVRKRCQLERVYTLKRIATRAARNGDVEAARRYGVEALRASFGFKWLGYVAWLYARKRLSKPALAAG